MAPPGHVGGWGGQLPHQKSEVGRCYSAPHHLILIHLQPLAVPLKHLSRASIMSCVKLGCAHGVVRPSRLSNMEGWDGARGHTAISVSGKSSLMESCLNPFKQNHTVAGILQTFPNGTTHMTTSGFRQSCMFTIVKPSPQFLLPPGPVSCLSMTQGTSSQNTPTSDTIWKHNLSFYVMRRNCSY